MLRILQRCMSRLLLSAPTGIYKGGDQYIEGLLVDRNGPDEIRFFLVLYRNLLTGQTSSSRVRYEMSNFDRKKEIKPLG